MEGMGDMGNIGNMGDMGNIECMGDMGNMGDMGDIQPKKNGEKRFQSKRPFPPLSHDDQFGKSHRGNQLFKPLIFCFR